MAGQPTLYKEGYCVALIDHMSKGFSYESFAAKIGTCRQTLYNWEKEHPEFLDSKKQAQELCQYWWESAGINGLYTIVEHGDGGEKNIIEKKINPSMWIFNMKARFRWKDEDQKPLPTLAEKEVLTIEEKRLLLAQAKDEIKKLEAEIGSSNGNKSDRICEPGSG
jgi:DNA-binding XRE family transcriptional regulator